MSIWEYFTDPEYALYAYSIALIIPVMLFSIIASAAVNGVFKKYNAVRSTTGVTAEEYVRRFLAANDVQGIRFAAVGGSLTDNFDPRNNTISLSDTVRGSASVGAIGVACHEAGHAIQHAKKYFFSSVRLKLVPVVNIMSNLMWPVFIIGFVLGFATPNTAIGRILIAAGLAVMGATLLFSLVTLPTEFNASRRAYDYLKGFMPKSEAAGVRRVLTAAAMTYVASFLMTTLQFLRLLALILMSTGRNRRR